MEGRRRERRSSSGVVGAPLEDEEDEGGWRSVLLRRWTTGSVGFDFLEMDRKKRVLVDFVVRSVLAEGAVDGAVEAASDLSERFPAKTAAMRRMDGRSVSRSVKTTVESGCGSWKARCDGGCREMEGRLEGARHRRAREKEACWWAGQVWGRKTKGEGGRRDGMRRE